MSFSRIQPCDAGEARVLESSTLPLSPCASSALVKHTQQQQQKQQEQYNKQLIKSRKLNLGHIYLQSACYFSDLFYQEKMRTWNITLVISRIRTL